MSARSSASSRARSATIIPLKAAVGAMLGHADRDLAQGRGRSPSSGRGGSRLPRRGPARLSAQGGASLDAGLRQPGDHRARDPHGLRGGSERGRSPSGARALSKGAAPTECGRAGLRKRGERGCLLYRIACRGPHRTAGSQASDTKAVQAGLQGPYRPTWRDVSRMQTYPWEQVAASARTRCLGRSRSPVARGVHPTEVRARDCRPRRLVPSLPRAWR